MKKRWPLIIYFGSQWTNSLKLTPNYDMRAAYYIKYLIKIFFCVRRASFIIYGPNYYYLRVTYMTQITTTRQSPVFLRCSLLTFIQCGYIYLLFIYRNIWWLCCKAMPVKAITLSAEKSLYLLMRNTWLGYW